MVVVLGLHIPTTTFASENLTELAKKMKSSKLRSIAYRKICYAGKRSKINDLPDESLLLNKIEGLLMN